MEVTNPVIVRVRPTQVEINLFTFLPTFLRMSNYPEAIFSCQNVIILNNIINYEIVVVPLKQRRLIMGITDILALIALAQMFSTLWEV